MKEKQTKQECTAVLEKKNALGSQKKEWGKNPGK